ncbi:unnamed protein product [Schistosoma mattheei]|uniref:Uncharacterized protein n=1 Tax=Schistosoma mattheei TaxID=31246 RepID=A0A183P014_9TREM|nr:unnamed protein product [Schistosoma mattheei]
MFVDRALEDMKSSNYFECIIDKQEESAVDVEVMNGTERMAFLKLKNVRNSKQLSVNINVRIFNMNVKAVLPYGVETSRTTTTIIETDQVFINSCLRRILNIR